MKKNLQIMFTLLIFCSMSFLSIKYIFPQPPENKTNVVNSSFKKILENDNKRLLNWAQKIIDGNKISDKEIETTLDELGKDIIKIGNNLNIKDWIKQFTDFNVKLTALKNDLGGTSYITDIKNLDNFFLNKFALTYLGLRPASRETSNHSDLPNTRTFILKQSYIYLHDNPDKVIFYYAITTDFMFPWSFIASQYKNLDLTMNDKINWDNINANDSETKKVFNDFKNTPSNNKPAYFDGLSAEKKKMLLICLIEATDNTKPSEFIISPNLEALIYGVSPSSYKSFVFDKTSQDYKNIFIGLMKNLKNFRNFLMPGWYNFENPNNYELLYMLISEFIFLNCFNHTQQTADLSANGSLIQFFGSSIAQFFKNVWVTNALTGYKIDETDKQVLKKLSPKTITNDDKIFETLAGLEGPDQIKFLRNLIQKININ